MSARCKNCGYSHVTAGCNNYEPVLAEEDIEPFLMVITEVDEESQTVTLHSVFDWEVPAEMKWFYGSFGPCDNIEDAVGTCYEVTLRKMPK